MGFTDFWPFCHALLMLYVKGTRTSEAYLTLRELSKVNAFLQCTTCHEGLITAHYDHSDSTNFLLHLADQVAPAVLRPP